MKIAAVIVSRKNSERILHKSRKKIKNLSLIERKIIQLKKVKNLDKIYPVRSQFRDSPTNLMRLQDRLLSTQKISTWL